MNFIWLLLIYGTFAIVTIFLWKK